MIENISVVILTKNNQSTIEDTLQSVQGFSDVVVYDNGSTDKTISIVEQFSNVNLVYGKFNGFGWTKNKATTYAKNDWVFILDSDEVVYKSLYKELQTVSLNNPYIVFVLKRDNYFFNKKVKYSGWKDDYLIRIYNKTIHKLNDNIVHEFVQLLPKSIKTTLTYGFKHNAVQDLNQFLFKVAKYSDLASQNKKTCTFMVVVLKSFFAFFKTYFLQLGFLDGWRGFVIAVSNFNGKFFRYTKRYINCKETL